MREGSLRLSGFLGGARQITMSNAYIPTGSLDYIVDLPTTEDTLGRYFLLCLRAYATG